MSDRSRLVLVLLLLLLPLCAWAIGGWRDAGGERRFTAAHAPRELAGWTAVRDDVFEDDLRRYLGQDYLLRLYASADGAQAWVYVAFYTGYESSGAHDPTVCYPSQGWVVSDPRNRAIPVSAAAKLSAKVFRADMGRRQDLVLHWFQPAGRWPVREPTEPFLRVLDAFSGGKQYAFVRLSTPIPASDEGNEDAEARLAQLAAALAPWVRATVEGSPSSSRTPGIPTDEAGR